VLHAALDVLDADGEVALAIVDPHGPTAAEERSGHVRIFFRSPSSRREAQAALERELPSAVVVSVDVDDEDWARRSQESLAPITVGRLAVLPDAEAAAPSPSTIPIVIRPSTGFGTGHHATTRLCLKALQSLDLEGRSVLDIGTGSGILAIAARMLGARSAVGIDNDPDAVLAATDNLRLNQVDGVRFHVGDVSIATLPRSDIVVANLTGHDLRRLAHVLMSLLGDRGTLIVSGLLAEERDGVVEAFSPAEPLWEASEDGWTAIRLIIVAGGRGPTRPAPGV
jgi:ribosomal protein L11 methyltransferase